MRRKVKILPLTWRWPDVLPFKKVFKNRLKGTRREPSIATSPSSLQPSVRELERGDGGICPPREARSAEYPSEARVKHLLDQHYWSRFPWYYSRAPPRISIDLIPENPIGRRCFLGQILGNDQRIYFRLRYSAFGLKFLPASGEITIHRNNKADVAHS